MIFVIQQEKSINQQKKSIVNFAPSLTMYMIDTDIIEKTNYCPSLIIQEEYFDLDL